MRLFLLVSFLLILHVNLCYSLACIDGTVHSAIDNANEIWEDGTLIFAKRAGKDEVCSVRFKFNEYCNIDLEPLPKNAVSNDKCRMDSTDNSTICECRTNKCVLDKTVIEEFLSGIEGTETQRCVDRWRNLDFNTIPKYGDILDKKVQCFKAAYKLNDEGEWKQQEIPVEDEENVDLACAILFKDNAREVLFTGAIAPPFFDRQCDDDDKCFCSTDFCNKNLLPFLKMRFFPHAPSKEHYELHLILNPWDRTTTTTNEWEKKTTTNIFPLSKEDLEELVKTTTTVAPAKEPVGPDPVAPKPVGRGRRRRPDGVAGKEVVHVFLFIFVSLVL